MDGGAEFIDAMKDALRPRPAAGYVITIVREMLSRGKARGVADDLFAFDDQLFSIGLNNHPFAAKERDGAVRLVLDGDEVDKSMRCSHRKALSAMMVDEPVQMCREAG